MTALNDSVVAELKKLTKSSFNIDDLLSGAADLKYTREIKRLLAEHLEAPSDEFVKMFASKVFSGILTPQRREYFGGLTKRAFKSLLSEQIGQRLQSAMGEGSAPVNLSVSSNTPVPINVEVTVETPQSEGEEPKKDFVVTTEDELQGFYIIKAILRQHVDPARIISRDTQSYFGILLDDNNRKPLARLHFNRGQKYLGLFDENRVETRVPIGDLNDIYAHANEMTRVLALYEKDSPKM